LRTRVIICVHSCYAAQISRCRSSSSGRRQAESATPPGSFRYQRIMPLLKARQSDRETPFGGPHLHGTSPTWRLFVQVDCPNPHAFLDPYIASAPQVTAVRRLCRRRIGHSTQYVPCGGRREQTRRQYTGIVVRSDIEQGLTVTQRFRGSQRRSTTATMNATSREDHCHWYHAQSPTGWLEARPKLGKMTLQPK
jgi:hypothetical protein